MKKYVLAIDQGTTSTRAVLFDRGLRRGRDQSAGIPAALSSRRLGRARTGGSLAHDAARRARSLAQAGATPQTSQPSASPISARRRSSGIARPAGRSTTRSYGRIAAPPTSAAVEDDGSASSSRPEPASCSTPISPQPSSSGFWKRPHSARDAAERGELAFGTVDSFLMWRLTGGMHVTDATNASRTLLFDIRKGDWDDSLLSLLRVPRAILPEVRDCTSGFGSTDGSLLGAAIRVSGIAGDQQAATVGQACFEPGMLKSTYELVGCFALLDTGNTPVFSSNRLLTTIAYRIDGKTTFALEGSIFVAGAAVQWLRDGLGVIADSAQSSSWLSRPILTRRSISFRPSLVLERLIGTPLVGVPYTA